MTHQPPRGRAGVAPTLERCPICGQRGDLVPDLDREPMCPACWGIYAALLDDQTAAIEREPEHEPAGLAEGVPDALRPLLGILLEHELQRH